MKVHLITALIILSSYVSFAQKDYMEIIAQKSCECLEQLEDFNSEALNMKLGLCMIEVAEPYSDELLEDHGIDFAEIDVHGERLGELIGMKMASACPSTLLEIAEKMEQQEAAVNEVSEPVAGDLYTTSGRVTRISEELFVEFSIRDNDGQPRKFYWLSFVRSNVELIDNYQDLKDKNVTVIYKSEELFDARIGEYRAFNVIIELEIQ